MPPGTKKGGAPSVAATPSSSPKRSSVTSSPSSAPAKAPSTPVTRAPVPPKTPKTNGYLYMEPRKLSDETDDEYRARLKELQKLSFQAPEPTHSKEIDRRTPGTFTLLSARRKDGTPTGNAGFDKEIEELEGRRRYLLSDQIRADKYRGEVQDIDRTISVLDRLGYDYSINGKRGDALQKPTEIGENHFREINDALAFTQQQRASKETARMGHEIQSKKVRVFNLLKQTVETLSDENKKLRRAFEELSEQYKRLLEGKTPLTQETENVLINIDGFMKHIVEQYETGGEVTVLPEEEAREAREVLDRVLTDTYSKPPTLEKTPEQILVDIASDGQDITKDNLVARGMQEAQAEKLIEELTKAGVII